MNALNKYSSYISPPIVLGLVIAGTGTQYLANNRPIWQPHLENRYYPFAFETRIPSEVGFDTRTPKEHLENIRSVLNPSMGELANLFDVSRQAIYKWLAEESRPESDKLEVITNLSKISDSFKDAGILRAGMLLNMRNSEGISLLDLLKAKKPFEQQVKLLIVEAKAMEISYQRSGLSQSNAKPTNDWMSSISIPAYPEDI